MTESVIETVDKLDRKASHFVEVEGLRLVLKSWLKGTLTETRYLCATALPIGTYSVENDRVIHRYDPATAIAELHQHQCKQRAQSKEVFDAVKRVAKSVGGRVVERDTDDWFDMSILVPGKVRIPWQKIQTSARADAVYVIPDRLFADDRDARVIGGQQELAVVCADSFVDVLARWHGIDDRPLFELIERDCGIAAIENIHNRSARLVLDHTPKKPAAVLGALSAAFADYGEGDLDPAEWKKELASKRLLLWWDS